MSPLMPVLKRKHKVLFSLHHFLLLDWPSPIPTILNSEDPRKKPATTQQEFHSVGHIL